MNPATRQAPSEQQFVARREAPRFDNSFVRRARLTDRLLGSPPARLVLLKAPAGYSKTTCLAEWASEDRRPFTWISLDRRHNDPALLISSIVAALEEIEPVNPEVLASLGTPSPAITGVVLPRLGEALQQRGEPFVLVIDDLHVVDSAQALEVLETVLEYLPDGAQLAIATRIEPGLHLGRLRAQRQLVELTEPELAMTRAESGRLLKNLDLTLDSTQLEDLYNRTEGWPAALYLAGLAFADEPNVAAAMTSFAGDDRIVADYLRDEFLGSTSPSRLRFLIRTSVLEELSGSVCDAVLERSGSGRMLHELARSNSLVVPLERNDGSYRYHHLFAEMLRAELRRHEPELEPTLHLRASHWYAANSDLDRAIDHAIEAGDAGWTGELVWGALPEMTGRGRIATLERWLDTIGDERIARSCHLSLASAHCNLAMGRGPEAAHWARIAAGLGGSGADGGDSTRADIHLLDATLAFDGVVKMGEDAARAAELFAPDSEWQMPGFFYRGLASHLGGDSQQAVPLLQEGARRGAIVSPVMQVLCLTQLSLIAVEDDDWEGGSRLIAQARDQIGRCGLGGYPVVSIAQAASALLRAHAGQIERAHADLTDAARLLDVVARFPLWYEAEARIILARASIRLDDAVGARRFIEAGANFVDLIPDAPMLNDWLSRDLASLGALGNGAEARASSLTKAELRTLQYLPSHLSFREIGEKIYISPNTVKTQAQAVYRKLGARSRTEAVERARDAGLIEALAMQDGDDRIQAEITRSG
jgi:LuxR family transcriptional regulator, maltose regulon positive regulatory protein